MSRRDFVLIVFALVLGFASTAAASEELTIVSSITSRKGESTTSTQYVSAQKVRTSDGRFDSIVDVASGKMLYVDHSKKTYYETSFAEMRAHFAELEEMLKANPMLGKMFGEAATVTVEKRPGSREIAGYTCQQYLLTLGKNLEFVIWTTDELSAPIEYYDARKMLYATAGPLASRFEEMFEEMKKIGGFTLATEITSRVMGMDMHTVSEATEVRRGPLPADAFEPPAGYKKKESPFAK